MPKVKVLSLTFFTLVTIILGCNSKKGTLFEAVSSNHSNIEFENKMLETMNDNMLFYANFYNGSGVGVLDVNNDGLKDVFFGGNQVTSRLYLNQGNMVFRDITETAGVSTNRWITGVSIVDINGDGYDDIYLSVAGFRNRGNTENILFLNNGDNTFTESAADFGLNEKEQVTQSNFFDFDNDGDLDVIMAVNPTDYMLHNMGRVKQKIIDGSATSRDRLFENRNGQFVDISDAAGILLEGYSLGLSTSDINNDGWMDIYISNDFITDDVLYINNGDGTFSDQSKSYFDLTAYASMGNDVADINNDGYMDIFTLDMLPLSNVREKIIVSSKSYRSQQMILDLGYHQQISRNVLQLNNAGQDFQEIGQLAGVSRSDWSWGTLLADFDSDGHKDIFITNGFRRELGSLDYLSKTENSPFVDPGAPIEDQIRSILSTPGVPLKNFAFRNQGDLSFLDVTSTWGFNEPSFSTGLAYSDLDNDGDLDLIVSNLDQKATIFENLTDPGTSQHYLRVKLKGSKTNLRSVGARVYLYQNGTSQTVEVSPQRGYLSSSDYDCVFGLGKRNSVDSIEVKWPNGKVIRWYSPPIDTTLVFDIRNAQNFLESSSQPVSMYTNIAAELDVNFRHIENEQNEFSPQWLLPHEHGKLGPGLAVADINGDGLDDFFIGGAAGQPGSFWFQQSNSTFFNRKMASDAEKEDLGSLFFDADNDGDQDLYVVSGGTQYGPKNTLYQDRLYINDGKGNFTKNLSALPNITSSGGSVAAADFDGDYDLDLFIGGRVVPGQYPETPESYLLLNQNGTFIDVTDSLARGLKDIGMISQAIWTDYDNDQDQDLLVVGEWMPITFFENNQGRLSKALLSGLDKSNGLWNSVVSADVNMDGLMDYILGNLGDNNRYTNDEQNPLKLVYADFDKNGTIDPILVQKYPDGYFPIASRDNLIGQLPYLRGMLGSYSEYSNLSLQDILTSDQVLNSDTLLVYTTSSSVLINEDGRGFRIERLPVEFQVAPIYGLSSISYFSDLMAVGNMYSANVNDGPYAASRGILLSGLGSFGGNSITLETLGLRADAKSMAKLQLANGKEAILVGCNNDSLKILSTDVSIFQKDYIEVEEFDVRYVIESSKSKPIHIENAVGMGYLSQSSDKVVLPDGWTKVTKWDSKGSEKTIINKK